MVNAGDNQATVVGTDFPTQLGLSVFDTYGNPVPNSTVTFTLPLGGASGSVVDAGPYTTDASGNLTVTLHANTWQAPTNLVLRRAMRRPASI